MEGHPPGSRIADRYVVEERLGAGGMGVVLRARDERLDRVVALKVLSAAAIGDAQATSRLIREAKSTAALEHPNIVPIYDVGPTGDGGAYLAMQLVKGESLRARLAREGTLTLAETQRIVGEVGAALSHAHDAGIVHRDVKPDNVMLRADDGRAVVLDFGLAKRVTGKPEDHTLTAEGSILGTPAYLAPEQARGVDVDGRADQFALAVMTYELLSGRIPWQGATLTALLASLIADEPPPLAAELPASVREAVRRGLAKDPEGRFARVLDFVEALGGGGGAQGSVSAFEKTMASADAIAATDAPRGPTMGMPTGLVLAGLGAVALLAWAATDTMRGSDEAATSEDAATASEDAETGGVTLEDLTRPSGCTPEVIESYERAIRLLRAGNWGRACSIFEEVVEADPSCAAAQLRLANCAEGGNVSGEDARRALSEAAIYDDDLGAREQAFLRALSLLILEDDRPSYAAALAALPERFPDDAEYLVFAADQSNAPLDRRIGWAERAVSLDEEYSDAYQILARNLIEAGRRDEARSALARCRDAAPVSSDCITQEILMLQDEGRCDETLELIEQLARRSSDHFQSIVFRARTEAALGRPEEQVARTIASMERFEDSEDASRERTFLNLGLLGHFGKLDEVIALRDEGSEAEPEIAMVLAYAAIEAMVELDRDEEAARLAAEVAVGWEGAPTRVRPDARVVMAERRVLERARSELDGAEYERASARLERNETTARDLDAFDLWAARTGRQVNDAEGAEAALAALGEEPPRVGEPASVGIGGHVLALAGRPGDAVPRLRILARGCRALMQPFLSVRALLWLGDAEEAAGDHDAACRSYRSVVALWGEHAPTARTVREARARLATCADD